MCSRMGTKGLEETSQDIIVVVTIWGNHIIYNAYCFIVTDIWLSILKAESEL